MQELLDWLEYIEDDRQQRKIRHTLKDILVIVLFATLANADDWVEMALFAENYQDYLRKYIELKNGIPSHDTIRRVMGMISPEILQQLYGKWQDRLNQDDGELLKKIICIDGIYCESGDFVDLGEPIVSGKVIPVIVKTLIFNG